MNILITGVAGLIGSRFAEYVIDNKPDHNVIGIDDLSGGYESNIPEGVTFYKLDLMEYDKVDEIFEKHKINVIYHFAAYAAEGLSPFIRKFNYNNNLLCSVHLINCAIKYGIDRFVFTSSMAVYGGDEAPPFTETSPCVPHDPYGCAKLCVEHDLYAAQQIPEHSSSLKSWSIIRPHNVIGRNQNIWDCYRNVAGIFVYQLLNDMDITVMGTGLNSRAFSFMDDLLEPLYKAGFDERAKNQIINLGGKVEYTINDVAETLVKIAGKGNIVHVEERHEVKHAYCSYEKSEKLLDYESSTDLEGMIRDLYEWAKTQPKRERVMWDKYELDKGMYSFWKK